VNYSIVILKLKLRHRLHHHGDARVLSNPLGIMDEYKGVQSASALSSVPTDPLKPLTTYFVSWMGYRITPWTYPKRFVDT